MKFSTVLQHITTIIIGLILFYFFKIYAYFFVFFNILVALLAIAFYTLLERKILGYIQLRKGPNKVRALGLPQPFADALKLFLKESATPTTRVFHAYFIAPLVTLLLSMIIWSLYPYPNPTRFVSYGILFFLCLSRLNVYTVLAAGWASNSKYALLGAIRRVAQTISYEVSIALILLAALITIQSYDLNYILSKSIIPVAIYMLPTTIIWFITCLAETNRAPFDFVEGESELVSGFNVEFGGGGFALLFIAEYISILFIRVITITLFWSYCPRLFKIYREIIYILFPLKITLISSFFIWVRGALPRIRYDRLIILTWKSILPFSICFLTFIYLLRVNFWYYAGQERIALM